MISSSDILRGKILIVDDQEADVLLLERLLRDAGYVSITSTRDPLEVCELHLKNRYDLILLDLQMPGMDGFQVMEGLKEIEPDGYLPVLVLTVQPAHKLRAFQAGAKDFISKPFELTEVLARVHNMLEMRLLHKELHDYNDVLEQRVRERTADLRGSEARYRTLVDAIDDGIAVKDLQGRYVTVNPEFLRRAGLSIEEVLGKTARDIYPEGRALLIEESDRQVLASGDAYDAQDSERSGNGKIFHIRVVPLRSPDGESVGLVSVSRDVTQRRLAEQGLALSVRQLRTAMEGMVQAMATITEMRDPYTAGHQRRVSRLAAAMARQLGIPPEEAEGIRLAGIIHDVGKISVPAEILSKPGRITESEFSIINAHALSGEEILSKIEFPWPIARMVGEHHERLDGSGYPNRLVGDQICLGSRILGVADVVEAMASHRPYRSALGMDAALEEIARNRGTLYDGEVVDACLAVCRQEGFSLD